MSENLKRELAPISSGSRGLQLSSLDDIWRFANFVAKSGLAPDALKTPEALLVAIQMGAECGLTPMASLQNIAVINGRPSLWGDAQLAVCRASGVFDEAVFEEVLENDGDKMVARCTVRRKPDGKPCVRTFSVDDAKVANLWNGMGIEKEYSRKQSTWVKYPKRMLQMRARSWALRDTFGDALRGFRSAEEMQDVPRDPIPVDVSISTPGSPIAALADRLEAASKDPEETGDAATSEPSSDPSDDKAALKKVNLHELIKLREADLGIKTVEKRNLIRKTFDATPLIADLSHGQLEVWYLSLEQWDAERVAAAEKTQGELAGT